MANQKFDEDEWMFSPGGEGGGEIAWDNADSDAQLEVSTTSARDAILLAQLPASGDVALDPVFAVAELARLHSWASEVRVALAVIVTVRSRQDLRISQQQQQPQQAGSMSAAYALLERRIISRWRWLRRAYLVCGGAVGVQGLAEPSYPEGKGQDSDEDDS